jgi:hypothetical protein
VVLGTPMAGQAAPLPDAGAATRLTTTARASEGVMRMRAVLSLAARELRGRWLSWAVLILLVALAGGVVLTAVAGARRTDSAYPRFLAAYRASDALVGPADNGTGGYDDALARLPSVAAIAPLVGLQALPLEPGGRLDAAAVVAAPLDRRYGRTLEIPKMLSGRMPGPDRPGEIAVDQIAAEDLHLRVGSTLEMGAVSSGNLRHIRRLHERVVGIMVTRGSIVPVTVLDRAPVLLASNGLFRELGPGYEAFDGAYVKLRPGATLGQLTSEAAALARQHPYRRATGGQIFVADEATQAATVERSIRPQAVALALFALVLAVTALLIVGQVASRLLLAAASDNPTLAALGLTRRQLTAAGLAEIGAAAAAGAVLACGVAVAASPLMPIGPARLAEPDPGVSVDVPVLTVGFIGIVALLVARVAWPAWRLASARGAGGRSGTGTAVRHSRAAEWLARAGAPVTAVTGVRFAFDPGQGRSGVPVRSALFGLALSLVSVTAAATFGANLLYLVHTPRLYGQDWDAEVDLGFSVITPREFNTITAHVPGIAGWTYGLHGTVQIGDAVVPAIGLAPGRGPVTPPTLLAGRAPGSQRQIVLGTSVLRLVGKGLRQTVPVAAAGRRKEPAVIVGQAVFPYFGQGSFTPTDLGQRRRLQLRARAVRPGPAPGGGHGRLRAGHGAVLRHGGASDVPDHRPAAEQHRQLRSHRRHTRGTGRRSGPARPRRPGPVRHGVGTQAPPRLCHPQDARARAGPADRGHNMAGRRHDGARPADRPAPRGSRRSLGVEPVRSRSRALEGCRHAGAAPAADRAGGDHRRDRGHASARAGVRPAEPGGGTAFRIASRVNMDPSDSGRCGGGW